MKSSIYKIAGCLVLSVLVLHGGLEETSATGVKKMSDKVSSASLAAEIEKLPEVEFDSAWESDPIKFRTEIKNVLAARSMDVDRPFRRTVWFNQPSRITGKAKYYTLVISFSLGKSRRLQGDDIFLALQKKKEFSKDEIEFLKEVFSKKP